MTETAPETTTEATAPAPVDTASLLADPPKGTPEADAKGWAIYDRTLGQYVEGVTTDKPSRTEATKAVPSGHTAAVVRV